MIHILLKKSTKMSEFSRYNIANDGSPSGFSFENIHRNRMIEEQAGKLTSQEKFSANGSIGSFKIPSAKKTGTTIVGCVFKNGVILGADTRATNGEVVAQKNCEKIHYLSDNIYCCGAGTAADTEKTTELISSKLALLRMNTKTQSRVVTARTLLKQLLFRYQGHIGAALVLGGCDITGPTVYMIHPHGSTMNQSYTTMGSGCLAAMAVFETGWTEDMEEEEAVKLARRAVLAGVFNDLGSGSNCDICIIRMDGTTEFLRNDVKPNEVSKLREKVNRSNRFIMGKGLTSVLKQDFVPAKKNNLTLADVEIIPMET